MTDESLPILEDSLLFRDELTKRVRLELLGPTQEDNEEDKKTPLKARPTNIFVWGNLPRELCTSHGECGGNL